MRNSSKVTYYHILVVTIAIMIAARRLLPQTSQLLNPNSIFTRANTHAPSLSKHAHPSPPIPYLMPLISTRPTGTGDSKILTFDSSECGSLANLSVPQGVKLVINDKVKSYSPVNLPPSSSDSVSDSNSHTIELLVKPYPPVPSGGFGKFLCDLDVGETAPLIIKVRSPIVVS